MAKDSNHPPGMDMLVQRYRTMFRIPEKINHYSKDDYQIVERKFVKYALIDGVPLYNISSGNSNSYQ
jgi:hypothetical protein